MAKDNNTPQKKPRFSSWWIYGIIILFLIGYQFIGNESFSPTSKTTTSELQEFLRNGDIDKILIITNARQAKVFLTQEALGKDVHKDVANQPFSLTSGSVPQYVLDYGDLQNFENEIKTIKQENNLDTVVDYDTESNVLMELLFTLLPFVLIIGIWIYLMRRMSGGGAGGAGGQIFNIGKSKAKLFDEKTDTRTSFKDVAGLEGAKEEVEEIVEFLKHPDKYTSLGGKIPKGALLVGPPGTGKTLLAKAVAGEAKVPFFSLSGSDFVEMFVGVGASRVRDLFKQAKDKSPSIIFIDEIDAIGRARGKNNFTGSNDERENTLNQLLTEMDGFGSNTNVIVLAATNRADVLDKALMRAGRFDRLIYVDLPDIRERKEIFEVHLRPIKTAETLDLDFLSRQTPGFSGADIANVCNEAALIAARKEKKAVTKQDFLDAVDRIVGGLEKKNKIITPDEKKTIAYHEAGHATVSWMLEHAAPLVKVTIVPRGQSLGAAWYLPEERLLVRPEQMKDGNVTYYDSGQSEYGFTKPYSEETAQKIDTEISKLIEEQYVRAIRVLEDNKDKLEILADLLLEKEVIFKEDLERIFGKRPFEKHFDKLGQEKSAISSDSEEASEEEAEVVAQADGDSVVAPETEKAPTAEESGEPTEKKK